MLVSLILFGIVIGVLAFMLRQQLVRGDKLESIANNVVENMQKISDTIQNAKDTLDNPKLIEAFTSDDEVGTFFKEIQSVQEILNLFIVSKNNEEE